MRDPSLTTAFVGALLLMSGAIATPALAQCSDADGDGFFYESGCGTAQDCNDGAAGTYPGTTEVCDSYDNDCDGQIDNDPACDSTCDLPGKIGDDVPLATVTASQGLRTSVVWTGSEYGVAWADDDPSETYFEVYFVRLDASGNVIGQEVQVTSGADAWWPSLVWTGTHFGLAWSDRRLANAQVFFARLDASGNKLGDDVLVSYDPEESSYQSLVWTGAEYGLAWEDYRHGPAEIYFARLDASGNKLGSEVRITDVPDDSYEPSIVWTGAEYGVAWTNYSTAGNIYCARLDASGGKIGGDVLVTDPSSAAYGSSLVWTGSGYGVAWADWRNRRCRDLLRRAQQRRERGSARRSGSRTPPVHPDEPSMAWTGSEYGVIWRDRRDGSVRDVYFARISSSGQKIGGDEQFATEIHGRIPCLLSPGPGRSTEWCGRVDHPTAMSTFARLGCDCVDVDVDGDGASPTCASDCDDTDNTIYPAAPQLCDGINNDCDDPTWPAVPADEIDDDSDTFAECEGDCDDLSSSRVSRRAAALRRAINNDCSDPGWPAVPVDEVDDDGDTFAECEGDCDDLSSAV